MARHDGREHGEEHDELDEALYGARQVRKPCRRDAERQSHVQDGEAQHVAVELDAVWSPATRPEREDEVLLTTSVATAEAARSRTTVQRLARLAVTRRNGSSRTIRRSKRESPASGSRREGG